MNPEQQGAVEQAVDLLKGARRVLFVTGAGISADSGLPTYRGVGGLYDVETTDEGLPIEVLLSGPMFHQAPELTWKYLAQVEEACRGATFNRAHEILHEIEGRIDSVLILTQNVDGFHRAAGSTDVIDIHGDLHELRCTACPRRERRQDYVGLPIPPRCPDCSAVLRPDVVLFGEALPLPKIARLREELDRGFDVVFSIGTSSLFPYIVEPVLLAHQEGKPSVEINPGETEVSDIVDVRIPLRAVAAMEAIWSAVLGE